MTRQKTVFTDNREIAHKWFHEAQDSARNPQGFERFAGLLAERGLLQC